MRRFVFFAIVSFLALATGCAPSVSSSEAVAISQQTVSLLQTNETGEIPPARWPPAVAALSPERVRRDSQGLYIFTSTFFVEERGVFVLDPKAHFDPPTQGDPSYARIAENVYIFRSAG